jgi:hypothetical protein
MTTTTVAIQTANAEPVIRHMGEIVSTVQGAQRRWGKARRR